MFGQAAAAAMQAKQETNNADTWSDMTVAFSGELWFFSWSFSEEVFPNLTSLVLVLAAVEPEISGILGPIQQVSHDGSTLAEASMAHM